MDARTAGKLAADRARIRALLQQQQKEAGAVENETAQYGGYDADAETHFVDGINGQTEAAVILTNAGLATGDPVVFQAQAIDAMPRFAPVEDDDPVLPDTEPVYGVLLLRRAYLRTVNAYTPPAEAVYSDPVPAQWVMVYRSTRDRDYIPAAWDPTALPRYCEGGSLELCGYGAVATTNDPNQLADGDPYCRTSIAPWRQMPDRYVRYLGLKGARCHYYFAKPLPDDQTQILGGIVVAQLVPSPDEQSQIPTEPVSPLPVVTLKVVNPEYPNYEGAPPGQTYLSCDMAQGSQVDMGWTLVETAPFSDYVPPRLLSPATPGGVTPIDQFESQYWLVTSSGAVKVLTLEDYADPADGADSPLRYRKPVQIWTSADSNGTIHLDFRISEPVIENDAVVSFSNVLKHYQAQGLAVSEVETSASWRRYYTNSPTGAPLPTPPNSPPHPCVLTYQANPAYNLAEDTRQLFQLPQVKLTDLNAGNTLKVNVWSLPNSQTCSLPSQPDETRDLVLSPFDPKKGMDSNAKDEGVSVAGVTYFG